MKSRIVILLIIIIILALITFIIYKAFFNKEETLGGDTFIITFIEKQDNIEKINNILLVDTADNALQIVMIPAILECEPPGLSKMPLKDIIVTASSTTKVQQCFYFVYRMLLDGID